MERTDTAIKTYEEQRWRTLSEDNFCVDLKAVADPGWRYSMGLALVARADSRRTADDVLELLSRRPHGLISTVSQTMGTAYVAQKLAEISEDQQDVCAYAHGNYAMRRRRSLTPNRGDINSARAGGDGRAERATRLLGAPREQSNLPRPKQWFVQTGRLRFICGHGSESMDFDADGLGFVVRPPKGRGPYLSPRLVLLLHRLELAAPLA